MGWLNDDEDAVVVAVAEPVEGHLIRLQRWLPCCRDNAEDNNFSRTSGQVGGIIPFAVAYAINNCAMILAVTLAATDEAILPSVLSPRTTLPSFVAGAFSSLRTTSACSRTSNRSLSGNPLISSELIISRSLRAVSFEMLSFPD